MLTVIEVSPIVGNSASSIFSKISFSNLGLGIVVVLLLGTLNCCCITLILFIFVVVSLITIGGLFDVCGTLFLLVEKVFTILLFGSSLLSGDSGLLSIFRFVAGLFGLSQWSILVIFIDDLVGF